MNVSQWKKQNKNKNVAIKYVLLKKKEINEIPFPL